MNHTNDTWCQLTLFLKQKRGMLLAPGNISCAMVGIPVNVFSTIRAMMLYLFGACRNRTLDITT